MRRLLIPTTVLHLAGFLTQAAPAQDRPSADPHPRPILEKQVQSVLAAKDYLHAAFAYRQLFKYADAERLCLLKAGDSDSIAIQAAWEQIERTIPEEPDRVVRLNRDGLARFIGFLEGRARVQSPQWWADALLDARANRRGNVYAGGLNVSHPAAPQGAARMQPRPGSFATADGKPIIRIGSESAFVPQDLREKLEGDGEEVSALLTSSHCYVAMYGPFGHSYRLACVDRSTAQIRWITRVWGGWQGGFEGPGADYLRQWVEVVGEGDRVAVFGVDSVAFHVEVFRKEDGVNLLRFSNVLR